MTTNLIKQRLNFFEQNVKNKNVQLFSPNKQHDKDLNFEVKKKRTQSTENRYGNIKTNKNEGNNILIKTVKLDDSTKNKGIRKTKTGHFNIRMSCGEVTSHLNKSNKKIGSNKINPRISSVNSDTLKKVSRKKNSVITTNIPNKYKLNVIDEIKEGKNINSHVKFNEGKNSKQPPKTAGTKKKRSSTVGSGKIENMKNKSATKNAEYLNNSTNLRKISDEQPIEKIKSHTICPIKAMSINSLSSLSTMQSILPILKSKNNYSEDSFKVISTSGVGTYGTVLQVKLKEQVKNGPDYLAIKVIDRKEMEDKKKLYQTYLENDILYILDHPFIEKYYGSFQSQSNLYIILEFISGGNLLDLVELNHPLKDETIRFYAAELVSALAYLRKMKVVHRDLKIENVMINENLHLKLIDFASAKIEGKNYDKENMKFKDDNPESNKKNTRGSLVFNPNSAYVSPEAISNSCSLDFSTDIWALGIIIYTMYTTKSPFENNQNFRETDKIEIHYPEDLSIPESAQDLINKILVKNPKERLGGGDPNTDYDLDHLKRHPYFRGINFDKLPEQNVPFYEELKVNEKNKINKEKCKEKDRNINYPDSDDDNNDLNKESGKQLIYGGQCFSVNYEDKRFDKEEFKISKDKVEEKIIILKEGLLDKKSNWLLYNKRYVTLDSSPRFTYADPTTKIIKGEIYLTKECRAVHVDTECFDLITPRKTFKFRTLDNDALVWEKAINDAIRYFEKFK